MGLQPPAPKGRVKLDVIQEPATEAEQAQPVAQASDPNLSSQAAVVRQEPRARAAAKVASKGADAKPPKKSVARIAVEVAEGIASAADPRKSKAVPTASEWEPYLTRGLQYLSVFYIWWLTTDADGEELSETEAKKYELDGERANYIAGPFARVWARTPLNRRYGRDLIENMDVLLAAVAIITYILDTRPLWRARAARIRERASGNKVLDIRRAQSKSVPARQEPQPLEQSKPPPAPAPVSPPSQPTSTTNGEVKGDTDEPFVSPFKGPLGFEPGEQFRSD